MKIQQRYNLDIIKELLGLLECHRALYLPQKERMDILVKNGFQNEFEISPVQFVNRRTEKCVIIAEEYLEEQR